MYALAFLLLASCAISACDTNDQIGGASITGPATTGTVIGSVTVEPATVAAELGADPTCRAEARFGVGINLNFRTRQELLIRGINFEFFDLFRRRVLPLAFPGAIEVDSSVLAPVSLPTVHPVPIPGRVSMSNVIVPAGGSFVAPFRLQFDCGVPARGTLHVSVEAADLIGTVVVTRTSAHIGE